MLFRSSAPAAANTGKGGGKSKDKTVCYFFNNGGCNKSAESCNYAHVKLSAADVAKLAKPPGRSGGASRNNSPAPKAKAKADPQAKSKAKSSLSYCFSYNSAAGCEKGDKCPFMHLGSQAIEEYKRAQKVSKGSGNTKP